MLKTIFFFLIIFSISFPSYAIGEHVNGEYSTCDEVLEDFSKSNLGEVWWRFGSLEEKLIESVDQEIGPKYLQLSGSANDWYVGGRGLYVAKNAQVYQAIEFWLLGNGPNSGKVKIELFDDDNRNGHIEQDAQFQPVNDDKFEYELVIDWKGWKKVSIPFSEFHDTNPGVGNDIWDPDNFGGSAGLVQIQWVFIAGTKTGTIETGLGRISLLKK